MAYEDNTVNRMWLKKKLNSGKRSSMKVWKVWTCYSTNELFQGEIEFEQTSKERGKNNEKNTIDLSNVFSQKTV